MSDPRIELLEHRVNSIDDSQDEMKTVLKELTAAIHKLVIVDERQVQAALAMDRLSTRVDEHKKATDDSLRRLGERIGPLELAAPQNRQAFGWVQGGVLALAVVTLQFVATKVGLK